MLVSNLRRIEICFLIILLVVFISGCTSPTQTGNGVIIQAFESDFQQVYSGESVGFSLLVKNMGSVTAKNVFAELLNIDEIWNPGTETLPNEKECRYTGEGFSLLPPYPQYGTEGESHICTWTYTAPKLDNGFTMTYHPTVRVFYGYSSSVIKSVTILPKEEMKALQDQGESPTLETTSYSNSPVMIDVKTRGPIRSYDSKIGFPFTITINNVGGGIVCKQECKKTGTGGAGRDTPLEEDWNKIKINIDLDSDMALRNCEREMVMDLYKGQSNTVVCEIEATDLPQQPTQREIIVSAEYDYAIDKQIDVTVIGV